MDKIHFEAKGFYFFDFELDILREIGFEFERLKKKRGFNGKVFKVLKNPKPIELTKKREDLIKNKLPFMINAINIRY